MPRFNTRTHAHRHRRAALKAGPAPVQSYEYKFTDPNFRPDLTRGIGGQVTYRHGADHRVRLTVQQARFWVDQGRLERVNPPQEGEDFSPHEQAPEKKEEVKAQPNVRTRA